MNNSQNKARNESNGTGQLLLVLLLYCAASLFHFVHNAVFINDYPNLPAWITTSGVYITWMGITGIGVAGYALFHFGKRLSGLITVAVYAAVGLDGLGHYSLAPMSAHTFTMNLSIWLEAVTAILALIVITSMLFLHLRSRIPAS